MVAGLVASGWDDKEWFVVASGRADDRFDAIVRLSPLAIKVEEEGVRGSGVHCHLIHGDTWLIDDGDLLVASRTLLADYKAAQGSWAGA